DPLGRFIILKIQIDDKVYVLVNIYAPNKDKDLIQFFRKLHGLLQTEDLDSEENIILGGDFNCPGIWKMNVSLLEDENYLEQLRINIPKWKQEGEIDLSDKRCVWD
ncbi:unnamed protein product, partial [Porites lobata]